MLGQGSHRRPARLRLAMVVVAVAALSACSGGDAKGIPPSGPVTIGLITKTDTNPFFVTMRKGAENEAKQMGVTLRSYAGRQDGDNAGQVAAIDDLIAARARGFLITPNDSVAIVPAIERARRAGLFVIALDTPTRPADAVDITIATDNFVAGQLIGRWAASRFSGRRARIAMLDLNPHGVSIDVQRDQGFLSGFGIDVEDADRIGDESDPRIAGHRVTEGGFDGARTAMLTLMRADPSINLVYTVNEPAAAGAHDALRSLGREKAVTIVSIDGGCPGIANVAKGVIGATSMQFPLNMALLGLEAINDFARTGRKPGGTGGLSFYNTGVELIADKPAEGLTSRDAAWGARNCWGPAEPDR